VPDLGGRAHAVVGQRLQVHGDAAEEPLVRDLFVVHAGQLAGAALDRALDVVRGHVRRARGGDRGAQARVALDVTAPLRAATVISLISLVKTLPRLASMAAFLCLIVLHFECPDIANPMACVEF